MLLDSISAKFRCWLSNLNLVQQKSYYLCVQLDAKALQRILMFSWLPLSHTVAGIHTVR